MRHQAGRPAPLVTAAVAAVAAVVCACGGGEGTVSIGTVPADRELTVTSIDLISGAFPRDLTCDGAGRAPAVTWNAVDPAAQSVLVELTDPDAGGGFVHWLAVGDRAAALSGRFDRAVAQGRNDFGNVGYGGPCPPGGQTHHYHLAVAVYSQRLALTDGFTAADATRATGAAGVTLLGQGELVATYAR